MPKYKASKYHPSDHQQLLREFFLAVAELRSTQEVANFFKDLLSVTETTMLARRLKVAQRLEAGKTYDAIAKDLDISKTTIARVQRWLEDGHDGYRVALERLAAAKRRHG